MSAMTQVVAAARGRRSDVRPEVVAAWNRVRVAAFRGWLRLRRTDTGTVRLILGILLALVLVYALAVTPLTRRH